jgi:hypothetical protein
MKTKKALGLMAALILVLSAGIPAVSQEQQTTADRAVVPLSDPSKPAVIEASVMRGGITVKGYNGKEVIVEARIRERSLSGEIALGYFYGPDSNIAKTIARTAAQNMYTLGGRAGEKDEEKQERSKEGMKLISAAATGLMVEEEDNVVTVHTESWKYSVDLTIQVPTNSSLKLHSTNDGDIVIENVNGELEINNTNGAITAKNVSGTVVANTVNGDIEVTLNRVTAGKPLSFTNMNGDVDITLPADIKADVKMKSQMGDIYSDFDVSIKASPQKAKETEASARGTYRIAFDKMIYGVINGGGQEITFSTFNGDIFIRRKK